MNIEPTAKLIKHRKTQGGSILYHLAIQTTYELTLSGEIFFSNYFKNMPCTNELQTRKELTDT